MRRTISERTHTMVQVNPILCDGVGMCSHFAPDLIAVDQWGYPILPNHELSQDELQQARAAVAACPVRALTLAPSR